MSLPFEEGQILLGRFSLGRRLRASVTSELWSARDSVLETEVLLRAYTSAAVAGGDSRERIKQHVRRHRRFHHPHAARICDLHEHDDMLLVSMESGEGELLSVLLERSGPVHYRQMVDMLRPVITALRHLHEQGHEHGRIVTDHILVAAEERWILLPGDGTTAPRNDLTGLGHLMAAAVTGGVVPDGGRELNDVAERLHGGRTVPALLNQLVGDLRIDDPASRLPGMQEVLGRLDQLDTYLEQPAEDEPAPVTTDVTGAVTGAVVPDVAPTVTQSKPRTRRKSGRRDSKIAWILVAAVLVSVAILLQPAIEAFLEGPSAEPDPPEETVVVDGSSDENTTTIPPETTPTGEPIPADDGKPEAEEALNRYMEVRRQADEIGAGSWAGDAFLGAATLAGAADASFVAEQYAQATQQYGEAAGALQQIIAGRDNAFDRLLDEGRVAIDALDGQTAATAFTNALLIQPGNDEAEIGLQRSGTLDQLKQLLAAGIAHEDDGKLALALVDYAAASDLDPRSQRAIAAVERIKTRLADQEFQSMMSAGLDAFHRGDYTAALAALADAQQFRPESVEVAQAIEMVREGRLREEVSRLQLKAKVHEDQEQWQDAWNDYRQALAIDADIQFAQEGKARCEAMIRLEKRAQHYLDNPGLLIKKGTREDAVALMRSLEARSDLGPKMQRMLAELAEKVRLANTPLRVVLRSDEKTSVDVYRVGQLGTFRSKTLELMPGVYTVVGHRKGYKDVRHTLTVEPGANDVTLDVACTETL